MNIAEFAEKLKIPTWKISVQIKNGRKIPIGENNKRPLIDVLTNRQRKIFTDYSLYLKYAKNIYCVDFDKCKEDNWNDIPDELKMDCELYRVLKDGLCYNTRTTKGEHFYCKINNMIDHSTEIKVYENPDYEIDLIKDCNNIWEQKDRLVNGEKVMEFEFDDIKHLFDFTRVSSNSMKKEFIRDTTLTENSQYIINDYYFNKIIAVLDVNEFKDFFKFTCICKQLNRYEDWDMIAKKHKNYDKNNNLKTWNSVLVDKYDKILEKILYIDLKEEKIFNKIKYKPIVELIPRQYYVRGLYDKLSNHIKLDMEESYLIQSSQGTGKTTLMKETFNDDKKINFISIVSRVNLAYAHYNEFTKKGISCSLYNEVQIKKGALNFITTIESLSKIVHHMETYKLDIATYTIFIDEINSLIEHTLDSSTVKDRIYIWSMLCDIIRNAYNIVVVDADISDITLQFITDLKPDFKYIKNDFLHHKDVLAEEMYNEKDIIDKCIEDIENNTPFFICCDSETTCVYLNAMINNTKVQMITSKCPMDKDTNLNLIQYLIFSPSIIYGLDDLQHRNIYCFYKEHTICPAQMVQQLTRCRNIKHLYYYFNKKRYSEPKYNNIEEVREDIRNIENYGIEKFKFLARHDKDSQLYEDLLVKYLYNQDAYETNKSLHFTDMIIKKGFKIIDNNKYEDFRVNEKQVKAIYMNILMNEFEFDLMYVQKVNEYLKLEKKEDFITYKKIFIDKKEIRFHFNICNYLLKDQGVINEYIVSSEGDDFNYKIFKKDLIKIDFLNDITQKYNIKFDVANETTSNIMFDYNNKNDHEKIHDHYKKLFNIRSKLPFNNNKYNVKLMIGNIFLLLFGNKLVNKQKKRTRTNNKDIMIFDYTICRDTIPYHEKLFQFRKPKKRGLSVFDPDYDTSILDEI